MVNNVLFTWYSYYSNKIEYVYAGNNSMLNNSQIHEKYLGCAFGLLRGNVLLLFMDKISTQNIYLYKKRQENIMKIMHLK